MARTRKILYRKKSHRNEKKIASFRTYFWGIDLPVVSQHDNNPESSKDAVCRDAFFVAE